MRSPQRYNECGWQHVPDPDSVFSYKTPQPFTLACSLGGISCCNLFCLANLGDGCRCGGVGGGKGGQADAPASGGRQQGPSEGPSEAGGWAFGRERACGGESGVGHLPVNVTASCRKWPPGSPGAGRPGGGPGPAGQGGQVRLRSVAARWDPHPREPAGRGRAETPSQSRGTLGPSMSQSRRAHLTLSPVPSDRTLEIGLPKPRGILSTSTQGKHRYGVCGSGSRTCPESR
ncbi:uncharacterized protein LOC144230766 [Crocuta crocuta]